MCLVGDYAYPPPRATDTLNLIASGFVPKLTCKRGKPQVPIWRNPARPETYPICNQDEPTPVYGPANGVLCAPAPH